MAKNRLPEVLKDLRLGEKLTQKQLAKETGLSLSAIISYENGLREPNSKAMSVLERYFEVSGPFLRGEMTLDAFYETSKEIKENMSKWSDAVRYYVNKHERSFTEFTQDMELAAQERQIDSLKLLTIAYDYAANKVLPEEKAYIDPDVIADFFKLLEALNSDGIKELKKRAEELNQLSQYCTPQDE